MPVCFDLKLKELCNSFDFVNIPKINIWLIKVRGFIPVYSRAHVLCRCQFCQPRSCPSSGLRPASCVPWVVWRLLKGGFRLSCGQVSQHKAKLPSNECNKRDPVRNSIKQSKLNAGNETKGVPTAWTIGYFFAKLPFAFYEQVPGVVRPRPGHPPLVVMRLSLLSVTQGSDRAAFGSPSSSVTGISLAAGLSYKVSPASHTARSQRWQGQSFG